MRENLKIRTVLALVNYNAYVILQTNYDKLIHLFN